MVDSPYSGAAARQSRYRWRPPVPGVNADHTHPDPEPDLFNPVPETPAAQTGTVWQYEPVNAGQSGYPNLAQVPVTHIYNTPPPAGPGVPRVSAMQWMQDRMVEVHAQANYVPDSIRLYQHATEGQDNQFIVGRMPVAAGATIADGPLAGLQYGRNSYDAVNQPNEVYTGDAANVGRYRLGVKTNVFGLYENPLGKFGQDAMLRSGTGLYPDLPQAKPQMRNTAPYTPNSSGTAHWVPAVAQQQPYLFGLPSETAITDRSVAEGGDYVSDFEDRSGGFY